MATAMTCDGCDSVQAGNEFEQRGYFSFVDYCPACCTIYDVFVKARDDLHTKLAGQWTEGLEKLTQKLIAENPKMKLPDA